MTLLNVALVIGPRWWAPDNVPRIPTLTSDSRSYLIDVTKMVLFAFFISKRICMERRPEFYERSEITVLAF